VLPVPTSTSGPARRAGHNQQERDMDADVHMIGPAHGQSKIVEAVFVQQFIQAAIKGSGSQPSANGVVVTHIAGCRSGLRLPIDVHEVQCQIAAVSIPQQGC